MKQSETNAAEPTDWEFILYDLKDDCKALLFFSVLIPLIFLILILPIYFLGEYGFLYVAVFSPVMFVLAILVLFSLILYNLIPAIISSESLSPVESIMNVFRFVRRELINIPFYLMLSQIVYLFISQIVIFLFGAAFILSLFGIFYAIDPAIKTNSLVYLMSLKSILSMGFQSPGGLDSITVSFAIIFFFVFIIMQILVSYNISLHQSLIAQSCWIMNKNRENSVSKNAILAILSIVIPIALIIIYFASKLLLQSVHF